MALQATPLTRRMVLRAITTLAALAALPAARSGTVVMVIRHAEKPASKSAAGIDLNGKPDTHSLTETGWTRAVYLVDLFAPLSGSSPPGLPKPRTIYAAGVSPTGDGTRTRETVGPLAAELGIPVNTKFGKGDEAALVQEAASQPGPTLICWQHGEIPAIGAAFGQVSPAPPSAWPDNQFDDVWVFTATGNGWRFQEVPQKLLPGDRA